LNVFYLSSDYREAARYHNNKHCVRMILESAQLLSTAHRVLDGTSQKDVTASGRNVTRWVHPNTTLMQATHINHPSAVWVRESSEHYQWLYELFRELMMEYTYRYEKHHACERLINDLATVPHNIQHTTFVEPPLAMPDDCKISSSAVECYREYYRKYKASFSKWKNRPIPDWFS